MALVFLMAVSLSMDAFSLALIYGTLGMKRFDKICLSLIVGLFHFVMPLLGMGFGSYFKVPNFIVGIILCFIGLEMIISSFKENDEIKGLGFGDFFLFGLAVSIDSFSVGITLPNMSINSYFSPVIFALCAGIFTLVGLMIGNKIERLLGKLSTVIGGVILIIIGVVYGL